MTDELRQYIIRELKYTSHVKYHRYIDEYINNLTDWQIRWWETWRQGKMGLKKAKHPYGVRGRVEHEKRKIEQVSPNHDWVKVNVVTNEDGSDDVVCTRCGLKAKRYMSELKFDMRFIRKIQHCID